MNKYIEIYRLSEGYSPSIYINEKNLIYSFPVSSGFIDLTFEFIITEEDFEILKSNEFRFKALYYILFTEAQATFGIGHLNPRKFTIEEFESAINKILYQSERDVQIYIKEFSKKWHLAETYFEYFTKNVFCN